MPPKIARLLWYVADAAGPDRLLRTEAKRIFDVGLCTKPELLDQEIRRFEPQVLCFDLERARTESLLLLQKTKRDHPSLAMLFLTSEHSEAIAVWAFRARVWNYLVKPLSASEFAENLRILGRFAVTATRTARALALPAASLPPAELGEPSVSARRIAVLQVPEILAKEYGGKIAIDSVAARCGMNRFQFSRVFKAVFAVTFREYLLRYRINKAADMLAMPGRRSISDIATDSGFSDGAHFTRLFKRLTGVTPSAYQSPEPP